MMEKPYSDLQGEFKILQEKYEILKRDYDNLKEEYESLRRPFQITAQDQYADVWRFNTSSSEGTFHPAQKPLSLMIHMVRAVTREGDTVLDPFSGSGTTGIACLKLKRNFKGFERDPKYYAIALERLEREAGQEKLF